MALWDKWKTRKAHLAPLEKTFDVVLTPIEEFIHKQSASGILLMLFMVIALILANSPWSETFLHFFHNHIVLAFGDAKLDYSLHHWINDGLMALFFFVVGLEIKREVLVGELASVRQAMLPIIAAIGGMAVPALFYAALNYDGLGSAGWGVPMATDIAFAMGVLTLLGRRIPVSLMTFLLALAIVDDLGAVAVIAMFYTEQIHTQPLLIALGLVFVLFVFNLAGIRRPLPYFLIGIVLWVAMLKSGIHATLAGIFTAWMIPARSKVDTQYFYQQVMRLMDRFKSGGVRTRSLLTNQHQRGIVQALDNGIQAVQPPLQYLEHHMHMPVAFIIMPLFALANAGVPLAGVSISQVFDNDISLGIILGLLGGKFIGITIISLLACRLGIAQLPQGTNWRHIIGVGLLGGIGFTMSIFIANLAFTNPESLLAAKTGILLASVSAGVLGYLWLFFFTKKTESGTAP
ncbi:Na+/H+ antiporter NhaA [Candidatus Venteria ishoeyi]|uniref:Na(+)/H(+) antiporter NhaA n=1 Tax=Candidatus Venteria ishoeyi TaxID=1899563 RepID=A0A1H6FBQ6_9GAMM|nr:Na+/H+ antiporter NhaA [Candidatus Venteria ishoeyi]MDM8547014.1 Na+/H+ antiporter NhaA [Candidatus Venteria ishoeyi]SEH06576.1 Na(+)/H(+) antiporter NhaA [Candidatus Venteria ishoeyi]